jgi:hypothetical protein
MGCVELVLMWFVAHRWIYLVQKHKIEVIADSIGLFRRQFISSLRQFEVALQPVAKIATLHFRSPLFSLFGQEWATMKASKPR